MGAPNASMQRDDRLDLGRVDQVAAARHTASNLSLIHI